jgi:hypothetical protein
MLHLVNPVHPRDSSPNLLRKRMKKEKSGSDTPAEDDQLTLL